MIKFDEKRMFKLVGKIIILTIIIIVLHGYLFEVAGEIMCILGMS
jgi:hypothetical protein